MRYALIMLAAGHLCLGAAHVAMLPPWEGFDETAHYSSLQQIADAGRLPRLGSARIARDVRETFFVLPIPYSSAPPVEQNLGHTYRSFFASPDLAFQGKMYIHSRPPQPRRFVEDKALNWQAQHPPLYYLALTPVYLATRHLSWGAHLYALRLASYLLAWLALAVALYVVWSAVSGPWPAIQERYRVGAALGIGVWPLLFPQWYPEMARLGNDSLCALLVSAAWLVALRAPAPTAGSMAGWLSNALLLGFILGLGCLN